MPSLPSVCIMIATYDQQALIGKAVASALAQDYPSLKVVVSDDASTDETLTILAKINDPRFSYNRNDKNLGRVANYRHLLYELNKADWVLCLDGDDHLSDPHYISHAISEIEKNNIDEILFFQGMHSIDTGKKIKNISTGIKGEQIIITAASYFLKYFENKHFSHLATLYHRKMAIDCDFYKDDIISTDIASILRACIRFPEKKVILSKHIAGVWTWHRNNLSKNIGRSELYKNNSVINEIAETAIENGFDKKACRSWQRKWRLASTRSYIKSLFN